MVDLALGELEWIGVLLGFWRFVKGFSGLKHM